MDGGAVRDAEGGDVGLEYPSPKTPPWDSLVA